MQPCGPALAYHPLHLFGGGAELWLIATPSLDMVPWWLEATMHWTWPRIPKWRGGQLTAVHRVGGSDCLRLKDVTCEPIEAVAQQMIDRPHELCEPLLVATNLQAGRQASVLDLDVADGSGFWAWWGCLFKAWGPLLSVVCWLATMYYLGNFPLLQSYSHVFEIPPFLLANGLDLWHWRA